MANPADETFSPVTVQNGLFSIDKRDAGLNVNPDRSGGHVVQVDDDPAQIRELIHSGVAGPLPQRMKPMTTRAASGRTGRRSGVVYSNSLDA